ncbi:MAG TPA: YjfB family protein [Tepidisphaeraceae bacterium]|nr:YjfB family protein [Tepidisphaeraceae bacterium]
MMDSLVSAAVGLQQAKVTSQVQFAVARKLLDNQQQQGASVIKLIEAAAAGPARAGDALVAAATGLGGSIDTYA